MFDRYTLGVFSHTEPRQVFGVFGCLKGILIIFFTSLIENPMVLRSIFPIFQSQNQQGSLCYQTQQCIVIREIPQNCHRFVLFDSPDLMTPDQPPRVFLGDSRHSQVAYPVILYSDSEASPSSTIERETTPNFHRNEGSLILNA